MMAEAGEWIAASAAAKMLGCSRQWIYELVKAGKVRSLLTGGIRLVNRADIRLLGQRMLAGTER